VSSGKHFNTLRTYGFLTNFARSWLFASSSAAIRRFSEAGVSDITGEIETSSCSIYFLLTSTGHRHDPVSLGAELLIDCSGCWNKRTMISWIPPLPSTHGVHSFHWRSFHWFPDRWDRVIRLCKHEVRFSACSTLPWRVSTELLGHKHRPWYSPIQNYRSDGNRV